MNLLLVQIILALPLEGSEGYGMITAYSWACTSFCLSAVFIGQMFLSMGWNRWTAATVFSIFVALMTLFGVWMQQAYAAGSWEFALSPPFLEASMHNFGYTRIFVMMGFLFLANLVVSARLMARYR